MPARTQLIAFGERKIRDLQIRCEASEGWLKPILVYQGTDAEDVRPSAAVMRPTY
jgi:hypothetical protein